MRTTNEAGMLAKALYRQNCIALLLCEAVDRAFY